MIQRRLNQICPLIIIECMFDKDEDVRTYAWGVSGAYPFKAYEKGSVEVLLAGMKKADDVTRGDLLFTLARAGKDDPKVMAMVRDLGKDPHFYVRHCAHCALYSVTEQLPEFVSYLLDFLVRNEDSPARDLPADAPEDQKLERCRYNLVLLGIFARFATLSQEKPKEFPALLLRLLEDPSPKTRRQVCKVLGFLARHATLTIDMPFVVTDFRELRSETLAEAAKKGLFRDGLVEDALKKCAGSDSNRDVAQAATTALKHIEEMKAKKPDPAKQSPYSSIIPYLSPDSQPDLQKLLPPAPIDYSRFNRIQDGTSNTILINPDGGVKSIQQFLPKFPPLKPEDPGPQKKK
jgi:hypothetical protein